MSGQRPSWRHGLPYGWLHKVVIGVICWASLISLAVLGGYTLATAFGG